MLKKAALLLVLAFPLLATESPITMHMFVSSEVAYKTLAKLTGEQIILADGYTGQEKIHVDVDHATLEETLDAISEANHTWWRVQVTHGDQGAENRAIIVEQIR